MNMKSNEVNYIDAIPDECLAVIFHFLSSNDRKDCSLVCRRWYDVESFSRHRLTLLDVRADVIPHIPAIFARFGSVTELGLCSGRKSPIVSDEALVLISRYCRNVTRLKIRRCHCITGVGLAALARSCKRLRKFTCEAVAFGSKGMNAFLEHCSSLEKLSVNVLCGTADGAVPDPVGPGAAASSLKSVSLKGLYYGQRFGPLIAASKNLKILKIKRCIGDWDGILQTIARENNNLVAIHLESLQVSDVGLTAVSKCLHLETLHLTMTPDWMMTVGDEGLIAIAKNSKNLKELVLDGIKSTVTSLSLIACGCVKLERLVLCNSETIGDPEVSCIASKCVGLKKLCISGCKVSDEGIEAFASGCPNLVEICVKNCRDVSGEVADWLRVKRHSLAVNLEIKEDEIQTASE